MDQEVYAGDYAHAQLSITNQARWPGAATVSGVTLLGGVQQGTWTRVTTGLLEPGQSAVVSVRSAGPTAAQFVGQILTASFALEPDRQVQASGQFAVTRNPFRSGNF